MEGGAIAETPIAITMGDPAGVGPEIIVKGWGRIIASHHAFVIGDVKTLKKISEKLSLDLEVISVDDTEDLPRDKKIIPVIQGMDPGRFSWGKPTEKTAFSSLSYIDKAIDLIKKGKIKAIVTCPVSKKMISQAGIDFTGHTEYISKPFDVKRPVMCLAGERLKVALLTTHVPLGDVPGIIDKDLVKEVIEIVYESLRYDFGMRRPRIAVASINPHAGEVGGFEEEESLKPAIQEMRKKKIDVSGPHSGDTIYYRAYKGEFDIVIAPYHDQGLAPFKLVHFEDGVNITMGLPFVRTSVDHGTAYDIAGKGIASAKSLIKAFFYAKEILKRR